MGKIKVASGNASIEMDDTLGEMVERVIREAAPRTMKAMEDTVEEVYQGAEREWPVKTGTSKAALRREVRLKGHDKIEGVISNDAEKHGYRYVYAIKVKGKNTKVWTKLVSKPGKKAGEKLAAEIAEELADLSRG